MANLIYAFNASVDGYIEDASGAFDWSRPQDVFTAILEWQRPIRTYLYGRRLYETMAYWESPPENGSPEYVDFARMWQQARKIVFSRTLTHARTANTRIEHVFDPQAIRDLKRASAHDILIGGAELAAVAFEADLIDECHLYLHPVIVGGGKPLFPPNVRRSFELLGTERMGIGVVRLRYRVVGREK